MKLKKHILRRDIIVLIIGLILASLLYETLSYIRIPSKDILIYNQGIKLTNKEEALILLEYPDNINEILLVQGPIPNKGYFRDLLIIHNLRGDTESVSNKQKINTFNCISSTTDLDIKYGTCIFNMGGKIAQNIKIDVSLYNPNFKIIQKDHIIEIEKKGGIPGRGGFEINIDRLKGNLEEVAHLILSSENYDELYYDCSITPKQKCNIIKSDVLVVKDKNNLRSINEILEKIVDKKNIPPVSNKGTEIFKYNRFLKSFDKVNPDTVKFSTNLQPFV